MLGLCWHRWSKWKTYRWDGTVRSPVDGDVEVTRTMQCRTCDKCGKEQHRRVWGAAGDRYEDVTEGTNT